MKLARVLILIGSLLLLLSALLHCYGYLFVIPKMAATNTPPDLIQVFKALWLLFSVTGIVLCPVFIWASRLPNARGLVLLASLLPVAITILMLCFLGVFIGSIGMALSSLFLMVGGFLLPGEPRRL